MSKHKEGDSHAYNEIASKTNLKEILELAIAFEKSARDFYTDLIPKVSKNLRYLVEELAEEEQQHFDLFTRLAESIDIEQQLKQQIKVPVENHRFSDHVHLPELGDNPDDQAVLQYAMGREDVAMKQYRELADNSEAGPAHDLFEFLANEEAAHKLELEKIYHKTVYSGGPGNG
jgi:rubrerythrin